MKADEHPDFGSRRFIRHPVSIPVELLDTDTEAHREQLYDISSGGLCLWARQAARVGDILTVRITLVDPTFEALARVVWTHPVGGDGFEVGLQIIDDRDVFSVRMVEQICHIEEYRQRVARDEGRRLSPEQAAEEWVRRYAAEFPRQDKSTQGSG